ncbi:hypothetical protein LNI90_08260 [Tenacibaculum dicentrarchi]|nr:hypothetical protein [Tenacibaculum dicentrarchi]MCD8414508.1 hypothetical protein [Tenacibaculum dicentrarchi]MCD8419973.1 hypothetical protein [Tenacibaculum dicentrarchi]MCD8424642.1 hypothetical protein [Tenacibaculum dicentrarchi]MCD8435434.1 hypothetical protein [Tenacibaculum dicentrarchi]
MNSIKIVSILFLVLAIVSCNNNSIEKKGFQVREISEDKTGKKIIGLNIDSLNLESRPRNILLTNNPKHRLTPIYKVNYNKKTNKSFTGSNYYHTNYANKGIGNNWNHNFMPGFKAVYGYNFINISHYNNNTKKQNKFFEKPVLIKTLYYPAFSKDTLNYKPINRKYYMVSVYDQDSNNDGFITVKDLRRFYYFDIHGTGKRALIPENYSVMNSEYDSANDFMYVFAKADKNNNGQMEANEPTAIFWIDLNNPKNNGIQYQSK